MNMKRRGCSEAAFETLQAGFGFVRVKYYLTLGFFKEQMLPSYFKTTLLETAMNPKEYIRI